MVPSSSLIPRPTANRLSWSWLCH